MIALQDQEQDQSVAIDHEAELRRLLNAAPGIDAISATVRFADGHLERFTVTRPSGPPALAVVR